MGELVRATRPLPGSGRAGSWRKAEGGRGDSGSMLGILDTLSI